MKNQVVIYNTSATPDGMSIDDVFTYFELTGKLLWQENTDGNQNHPPQVFNVDLKEDAPTCNCSLIGKMGDVHDAFRYGILLRLECKNHKIEQTYRSHYHCVCDPASKDTTPFIFEEKHVLAVVGTNLASKIEVSQEVLDFMNQHDVEYTSAGEKVYKYNNIKYKYLHPVFKVTV